MMTIEAKIAELLDEDHEDIRYWKWDEGYMTWASSLGISSKDRQLLSKLMGRKDEVEFQILHLIKKANKNECLTSPSEFIRKAKQWYIENE